MSNVPKWVNICRNNAIFTFTYHIIIIIIIIIHIQNSSIINISAARVIDLRDDSIPWLSITKSVREQDWTFLHQHTKVRSQQTPRNKTIHFTQLW